MSRVMICVLALILCSLIITVPAIWAYWIQDGIPLCTATGIQERPTIASDGAGGAMVTWYDNRSGNYGIYIQRMDAAGIIQWAVDGVALCTATGTQEYPTIAADGAGGAIVTWHDYRGANVDVYAQRVNAAGIVQWGAGGVVLCTASLHQYYPAIVSDGAGGAIVTWEDGRSGTYDIYAQRVNAMGTVMWGSSGVALCTATGNQVCPTIVSDGAGGAIVTWEDGRSGTYDIYAQRVGAAGTVQWEADGIALCTATRDQECPTITTDGAGGAIVTWQDDRSADYHIYAQRVSASGVVQWEEDGVALCTAFIQQSYPAITSDGAGGAIITWCDCRVGFDDIYAQRVSTSGVVRWEVNGVALCTAASNQGSPTITSDGASGAIVTWWDNRSGNPDIYAQRVDSAGIVQWATGGTPLCMAVEAQFYPTIAPDGGGGAVVTWRDSRSGEKDIYAQCINRYGHPGFGLNAPDGLASQDVPGDQGGKITIQWDASYADINAPHEISYYSLWRRLDAFVGLLPHGRVMLSENEGIPAGLEGEAVRLKAESDYAWEWIASIPARQFERYAYMVQSLRDSMGTDPGWQYFIVCAHTTDPLVYYDSPIASGYSVDNLCPCAPACLAGEQDFAPAGLVLTWNPNTEADFHEYHVYRGLTEGFVPAPANLVASTCDTTCFDGGWTWSGGYYYKVSAVDVHGNESACALLRPEDITGTDAPKTPDATYLAQNFPNPFNPMTRIVFGLSAPAHVSLRIYDASGRLVRELVNEARPAARYEGVWDGRDGAERQVASGMYFYRLDAGSFTETKKMILLR